MTANNTYSATLLQTLSCSDWVLGLLYLKNHGLIASTSDGYLCVFPTGSVSKSLSTITTTPIKIKAHDKSINKIRKINENTIASCSNDGTVKIWDMKSPTSPIHTLTNTRGLPFLSLDSRHDMIVAGTELAGVDSELIIWDLNNLDGGPLRSFVDSHNDDITYAAFHPTRKDLLLSGSTDGYVILYDLNVKDEDDALLQCITFTSIHSTGFLSEKRIFTLSHMETFAVHEVNDVTTEEIIEPKPLDFGDIREKFDCHYIVDLFGPSYILCGKNSESMLKLETFDPKTEDFDFDKLQTVFFPGGHGEEVVRDMVIHDGLVYTGGEDGNVKVWKAPVELSDTSYEFFGDSLKKMKKKSKKSKNGHKSQKSQKRFKPY